MEWGALANFVSIYHTKSGWTLEGQVPVVKGCQGPGLRCSRGNPTSVSCELPAPQHRPSLACTLWECLCDAFYRQTGHSIGLFAVNLSGLKKTKKWALNTQDERCGFTGSNTGKGTNVLNSCIIIAGKLYTRYLSPAAEHTSVSWLRSPSAELLAILEDELVALNSILFEGRPFLSPRTN